MGLQTFLSHRIASALLVATTCACLASCRGDSPPDFDTVITGGTIYDGSGAPPYAADLGIVDDRITAIGDLKGVSARQTVDASGKAVSPGFINMIAWGVTSLIRDGRGISDVTQGITR